MKKAEEYVAGIIADARASAFLDAADLVDKLALEYASDPSRVRCRYVARELRARATQTGSKADE